MATATLRALAIFGCAFAAIPSLGAERTFDRHFDAPPGGRLTVDADVGSVTVVGHDSRDLTVHADMTGTSEFLGRLEVSAVQDATGVTVTERLRHRSVFNWFNFGYQRVRFTIAVPRDYPVRVSTSGGSVRASHLRADLHGRTSGGSIEVHDVLGAVDTRTSGGSIEAGDLDGPAELRTSGGSIVVDKCTGDLEARTAGGSIHLDDINGKVTATTAGGSVHATMLTNKGILLQTSGGSISLLLPSNVRASIDAHTIGGHAVSHIPLSSTEDLGRSHLRGAINGGGEPIVLRTSGGGIVISARD